MAEVGGEERAGASIATVFVSYASQDAAIANAVVGALERAGLKCWIAPRDVVPGALYADEIIRAIDEASVLVLVLSQHAVSSAHVGKEIERASSKRRRIIAVRTDSAALPRTFEYFLSESQWIDVGAGGIESAAAKLAEAVHRYLAPGSATEPTAAPAAHTLHYQAVTRRWRRMAIGSAAVVAMALAYLIIDKFWLAKPVAAEQPTSAATPTVTISDKSIAILPFVDMSEKHDQEYFSDGLSEELIDHLAHNVDLKVIARTSAFAFKGKNEDIRTIATKLGVAHLLEGSVRKAGGRLRITAQLIRASDGVHLWSETYERKISDIFKVQDEISTTVAKALNVALSATPAAGVQPASKQTTNIEAYNLLLKGNYFYDRGDKGDNAKAVDFFQQALKLDPHYAFAWAQLAVTYAWQGYTGELTAAEAEVKGRDAAERALAIDPKCALAYFSRGNILLFIVGDWAAAKSDYETALNLDPHGPVGESARNNALDIEAAMSGRFDEIIGWSRHIMERNPLNSNTIFDLAWYQLHAGHLDESVVTYRRLLEFNPAFATAQSLYGLTLLLMGKNAEALAAAQQESDVASRLEVLACVYWAMGRGAESGSALGALERGFADRNAYQIAGAHAYRSEADAAFAWLDRAYQQRKGSLEYLKVDPLFRNLRADHRFNALLRKAKLTE